MRQSKSTLESKTDSEIERDEEKKRIEKSLENETKTHK